MDKNKIRLVSCLCSFGHIHTHVHVGVHVRVHVHVYSIQVKVNCFHDGFKQFRGKVLLLDLSKRIKYESCRVILLILVIVCN